MLQDIRDKHFTCWLKEPNLVPAKDKVFAVHYSSKRRYSHAKFSCEGSELHARLQIGY